MTTGTKTIDLRLWNAGPTPPAGSYKLGPYFYKTWTGTDYPASKPSYTNLISGFTKPRYKTVKDGNGRKVTIVIQPSHEKFRKFWNKPPKRARIVQHPYSCSGQRITASVPLGFQNNGVGTKYYDDLYANPSFVDPWSSNDDLALLGKLRNAVAGSDFNAGIFLGEGHKALQMITDSATRIYHGFKAARAGNIPKAIKALTHNYTRRPIKVPKVAATNWLELQYGWIPLLQDVYSGAQFLAHHLGTPLQYRVTVTRWAGGRHPEKGTYFKTSYRSSYEVSKAWISSSKQIIALLKEKDVVAMAGLKDPLSVAWELMPYSFVIDWFIPVGSYLAARGLGQAITGTFITSTRYLRYAEGPLRGYNPDHTVMASANAKDWRYSAFTFSRAIATNLAIPLPSIKPLERVASWKHCANSVALLTNLKR